MARNMHEQKIPPPDLTSVAQGVSNTTSLEQTTNTYEYDIDKTSTLTFQLSYTNMIIFHILGVSFSFSLIL